MIFVKAFENFFLARWNDDRKIQFVIGYLEAEANEWAVLRGNEFSSWNDFVNQFKGRYWLQEEQQRLTLQLLDPPYYSKRWESHKQYFDCHLNRTLYKIPYKKVLLYFDWHLNRALYKISHKKALLSKEPSTGMIKGLYSLDDVKLFLTPP